jgi:hypothetical protein
MLMSPLLEMSLKSPPAPVTIISTYLTFEFLQFTKNKKFISNFLKHGTPQKLIQFINKLLLVCCKEQLQVEVTLALNKTRAQLPFTSTGAIWTLPNCNDMTWITGIHTWPRPWSL